MTGSKRNLITLAIILAGIFSPSFGAAPKPAEWVRGLYVAASPTPRYLPSSMAWNAAREAAAQLGNAAILAGSGKSMEPLYTSGTLMVVQRSGFHELARGQTVIYRNRTNQTVAHVLIAKCGDGWRVAGLNNPRHDGEGVNERNFLGLVVAAITPVSDQSVVSLR